MMNNLKKGFALIALTLTTVFGFVGNVNAVNCPAGSLRGEGAGVTSISECNIPAEHAGSNNLMETINTIINVVLGVLGLLAVIVIIYGGFMFMTATGDASKVKKAKDTIMYGVIGLVIALLAYAIVNFVVSSIFKS